MLYGAGRLERMKVLVYLRGTVTHISNTSELN